MCLNEMFNLLAHVFIFAPLILEYLKASDFTNIYSRDEDGDGRIGAKG